jgi:hypothetical protein
VASGRTAASEDSMNEQLIESAFLEDVGDEQNDFQTCEKPICLQLFGEFHQDEIQAGLLG